MKKNNITQLIILLLPNILWFTSCYEDKSSFATNLIPEVQISINDKNQEIFTQYDKIEPPKISSI